MNVAEELKIDKTVPCTACRYCTSYCPQELNIPRLLALYNDNALTGTALSVPSWLLGPLPKEKFPSACVGCRSCEKVCPQEIPISSIMHDFAEAIYEI